ncbi:hypothetical protein [Haliscomenobacter hydrossis]|uniref:Outer membrane protein beta-barrel domain-containing protein n=1 Tax=Haliscomenobacter hydrossis (strain ATCC 27775 / DSM 1100 / LMG 10767 / O) TaxID=760192 RepID=F4KVK4_HALH1|nr:hypothetical protein [Haliscomenobacter hydrossis]AEE52461.1 hypothetical protein Halhy_4625 [Haliscomenobacter hydrossis DSM 1100]
MKSLAQLIVPLLLWITSHSVLYGQKTDTTTFIKLYSNFYLFEKFRAPLVDYNAGYGAFEFGGFSPAIQWAGKKERKYHELELSVLRFKRNEDEIRILKEKEFSLRYEFGKRRLSKNGGKSYWQRGWSFRPFFYEADSEPLLRSGFPQSDGYYGFSFSYVPRYTVKLNSHLLIEANLIMGFTTYFNHRQIDNPALTKRQRDKWVPSVNLLDEIPLRLGISYRL